MNHPRAEAIAESPSPLEAHFRDWHHSIVAKAYFILRNTEEAKEIAQEAYLRLAKQDYATIQNPRAWLLTVARNLSLKRLEKLHRQSGQDIHEMYDLDDDSPSPQEVTQRHEFSQLVINALQDLPLAQREVIELIYLQQLTPQEAARIMGKKTNAIYQLTHSALRSLKNILTQENTNPASARALS